ncbi:major capsid family protein, partial [Xanthomonas hortorum]|uniref:major capsid family protein n=1 Tax=Xanthomonas hortorum TaxID=56454 RepID=UPI001F48E531
MRAHPLFDAQVVMGFVVSQTTIIEPGVYRTVYPDIQYRDLIPVDTSGSEFATSVTYYSQDQYGKADWINGNADDIPKAGTNHSQFQTGGHTAGIGYGYGWEEVGRAQLLGINLPNEDAAAARRAS